MEKRFYKFKITNQAIDAMERAFLNNEGEGTETNWLEKEGRLSDLRLQNRNQGLTKTEAKEARTLISEFNARSKEFKELQ